MSKEVKISVKNCKSLINLYSYGDIRSMAGAWNVIYKYCRQEGMSIKNKRCGIENVIAFMDRKIKQAKR